MTDHDLRALAGALATTPVHFVPGDAVPAQKGWDGGYFTPAGKSIANPRAYQRAGGKVEFRMSTKRVEVGVGWLAQQIAGQQNT